MPKSIMKSDRINSLTSWQISLCGTRICNVPFVCTADIVTLRYSNRKDIGGVMPETDANCNI